MDHDKKKGGTLMVQEKICVGVVGAGAISDIYLKNMITRFDNLSVKSICAAHLESAQKKAKEYGIQAVTMEEMLDDPEIRMIVNLTPAHIHYSVIRAALEHGKHVYTEKTLTDDINKSAELVRLANEKGLYLGSAPDTFMGAALQTARSAIDSGMLGEIHSFAVSANRNNDILLSLRGLLCDCSGKPAGAGDPGGKYRRVSVSHSCKLRAGNAAVRSDDGYAQ